MCIRDSTCVDGPWPAMPDRLMLTLMSVPQLEARVEVIDKLNGLTALITKVKKATEQACLVADCCAKIVENKSLRSLLRTVLGVANFLNFKTDKNTVAYALSIVTRVELPGFKCFTTNDFKHRRQNIAMQPVDACKYPVGVTGGMTSILKVLMALKPEEFDIQELEQLHQLLNKACEINVWEVEKMLEVGIETIVGLGQGTVGISECSPELHIVDRFHDWVKNKMGARVEQLKLKVSDAQTLLYGEFLQVSTYLWEDGFDPTLPLYNPPMHTVQRMLSETADLVTVACTSYAWLQKESALQHGRSLSGVTHSKLLRPSDTLAARAGQQMSRARSLKKPGDKQPLQMGSMVDVVQAAAKTNKVLKAISEEGHGLTPDEIKEINRVSIAASSAPPPGHQRTLKHGWSLVRKSIQSKMLFSRSSPKSSPDHGPDRNTLFAPEDIGFDLAADLERLEMNANAHKFGAPGEPSITALSGLKPIHS
eukprot:TRINITY_DN44480_c0_g1_i1.p1 TRINITY_DN44480_c0_g1~~TRINITY_DN44480_c0_g1_i1.p1  ORF type:complete len:480 (+),score=119.75 TRINITY_DN44480_c0_g1_i1:120-1559(+)